MSEQKYIVTSYHTIMEGNVPVCVKHKPVFSQWQFSDGQAEAAMDTVRQLLETIAEQARPDHLHLSPLGCSYLWNINSLFDIPKSKKREVKVVVSQDSPPCKAGYVECRYKNSVGKPVIETVTFQVTDAANTFIHDRDEYDAADFGPGIL